jgi:hypothetical protein
MGNFQMQEETFSINSENNSISFRIQTVHGFPDETFFMGGYDAECGIEIRSNNFSAKGSIFISTAEFHNLFVNLKEAYNKLTGSARIASYENDFYADISFDSIGHATIQGNYSKEPGNELKFCFETDQTFIEKSVKELATIVAKYGDNYGNKRLRTT